MKVLKVVEHCTLENMDSIKFIKFDENKSYYVGTSQLTNREFIEWAGTKSKRQLTLDHSLQDRVDFLNEMIENGIYMFGDAVFEIADELEDNFERIIEEAPQIIKDLF